MSADIRKPPSTRYRCDKVALKTTCIKNIKFKIIIKIRTGCQYVGYLLYNKENLNWTAQNLQLGRMRAAGWT